MGCCCPKGRRRCRNSRGRRHTVTFEDELLDYRNVERSVSFPMHTDASNPPIAEQSREPDYKKSITENDLYDRI